jgi:hypothetical protein
MKTIDSGKPGTWPGGEPKSVRDAYDRWLAEQSAASKQDDKVGGR